MLGADQVLAAGAGLGPDPVDEPSSTCQHETHSGQKKFSCLRASRAAGGVGYQPSRSASRAIVADFATDGEGAVHTRDGSSARHTTRIWPSTEDGTVRE